MSTVLVERCEGVVQLTLRRPEVRNALNTAMLQELLTALDEAKTRDADRVVVIRGSGGAFCGGADLSEAKSDEQRLTRLQLMNDVILRLRNLPKPVIAKVDGPAIGGGWSLALACDLIVASERSVFSAIFAQRGLSMDTGISWQLCRSVGAYRAREIAFFGDLLSAADAGALGLVNRVVPVDDLDDIADDWARRLARGARSALSSNKQLLDHVAGSDLSKALALETRHQTVNVSSPDAHEARSAFRERRPPTFN